MPFTWNNTQPSPGQNISAGQATILNNFNFLGDTTGNTTNTTGYIKFPSGLILNWGYNLAASFSPSGGDQIATATFKLPFVNPPYSIILTPQVSDSSSKRFVVDNVTIPTNTSFVIRSSTSSFNLVYWMAIGV